MQIHDVEQGSDAWHECRRGIPTASEFSKLITPTGGLSSQWKGYSHQCLAEWLGAEIDTFESPWMIRGRELEDEAASYYEMAKDIDTQKIGFITAFEGMAGASPDRVMKSRGKLKKGLEIKCPKPATHIGYLLSGTLPIAYKPQVFGSMLISGCKSWDFMSYHPDLDPLIIEVKWDAEYGALLQKQLEKMIEEILKGRKLLKGTKK